MARNEEKAQSMLNRFLAGKQDEQRGPKQRRPYLATECSDLNEADKWRQQILREIGRKVMEIQNAGLGEHRIRDLNDEINKLIREKGHWERRIVEFGGPDYAKTAPKITDSEGNEMAEASGRGGGYRYFGAAKNLPGVKELFEKEAPKPMRRTRYQMHKSIDPDYYGFRDEEDGVLLKVEAEAEQVMRARVSGQCTTSSSSSSSSSSFQSLLALFRLHLLAIAEWEEKEQERQAALAGVTGRMTGTEQQHEDEVPQFVAYVPLPDQQAIEQRVLEKKKQDLLAKYTSDSLLRQQEEAKALLNVQR
eukprot:jgi/Chrzof1/556/Cz01g20100.t1